MGNATTISVGSRFSVNDLRTEPGCRRAFSHLLTLSDEELAQQDVAMVNLLCATGLPSADPLDIPECLSQLDDWANYVYRETIRGYPQYLANPDPNKGSDAVYKLWALMHAVRALSGIEARFMSGKTIENYQTIDTSMKPRGGPYKYRVNSQVSFIHGLLSPRSLGSCASNPVLFAAIGRRLGYPVKIVLTVQHVFNRWVDENETFNMDGSMKYIGGDEDHDYIDRFRPWRDWERKSTAFHRPLTPREELATFMFNRNICECANLRYDEALESCKIAARFQPDHYGYVEDQRNIEGYKDWKRRQEGMAWLNSPPIPTTPVAPQFPPKHSPVINTSQPLTLHVPMQASNIQAVKLVFKKKERKP
jgi:hypothetical protein